MILPKNDGGQGREEVLGLSPGTHRHSSPATVKGLGGCKGARIGTKSLVFPSFQQLTIYWPPPGIVLQWRRLPHPGYSLIPRAAWVQWLANLGVQSPPPISFKNSEGPSQLQSTYGVSRGHCCICFTVQLLPPSNPVAFMPCGWCFQEHPCVQISPSVDFLENLS